MRMAGRLLMGPGIAAAVSLTAPAATAATAAAPQAITTTAALTASAAAVTRDSWVTFTATVSAVSGTPAGAVTFTDQSNGSVLDTAALSGGVARFATAALAPGSRSIVAHYGGDATFAASTSAALAVPVTQAGSFATA
jgi:hypothetical protein